MSKRNKSNAKPDAPTTIRCAIYTRKSSEEGLDQEFNSLDAQRESAEAFIASQKAEGWSRCPTSTTTAASQAEAWSARRSIACSGTSRMGRLIAWWSTKWTASVDR